MALLTVAYGIGIAMLGHHSYHKSQLENAGL
jgi:hypothetical protein